MQGEKAAMSIRCFDRIVPVRTLFAAKAFQTTAVFVVSDGVIDGHARHALNSGDARI
jgi:hypothetical protein